MQDQFPRDPDKLAPPENVAPPSGSRQRRPADWITGGLLVVVLLLGGLWVIDVLRGQDIDTQAVGVSLAEVAGNPEQYVGQRVTVSGVVRERISDRLFVLGDEELLVLAPSGTLVPEDAVAQVEGIVMGTNRGTLAHDLTMLEGDAGFDRLGEGDLWVLEATSIVVNPFVDDDGVPVPQGDAFDAEGVLSVDRAVRNFDQLEGETATVAGELSTTIVPHVAVFEGMLYEVENLLLVSEHQSVGTFPATATARVTGTLIRFNVQEIEERLGIDLDDDLVSDYEDMPTIVVDSIHYFLRDPAIAAVLFDLHEFDLTATTTVAEVYGDGVFTIGEGNALVIAETGDVPEEGARLRITGRAAVVDADGLVEALGEERASRLSEEQLANLDGMPVILAERIEPLG